MVEVPTLVASCYNRSARPVCEGMIESPEAQSESQIVSKCVLEMAVVTGAVATAATHGAQLIGLSFHAYRTAVVVAILFTVGLLVLSASRRAVSGITTDKLTTGALSILAVLCAVTTLVCHREDWDDFYYLPNAVYFLEHPSRPLDFAVHFVTAGDDQPFVSPVWGISQAFELTQAAVASFTGLPLLGLYYLVVPSIIAALIPMAFFALLSGFRGADAMTVATVALAILLLGLLGEAHRAPGNFLFTRMYQGKTVVLSLGLAMFVLFLIDFWRFGSVRSWLMSACGAAACTGGSLSAVFMIPVLASLVACSYCVASPSSRWKPLRVASASATSLYPVGWGLVLLNMNELRVGLSSPVNQAFPRGFWEQAALVSSPTNPVTAVVFMIGLAGMAWARPRERAFVCWWSCLVFALVLNPVVANLWIRYVTTPNAYWRLFYTLPLWLGIALTIHTALSRARSRSRLLASALVVVTTALLIGVHAWPASTSMLNYRTEIGAPNLKTSEFLMTEGSRIIDVAPAGSMLAPPGFSGMIPLLTSRSPQVCVREDGVRLWLSSRGRSVEAERRIGASRFVGGDTERFADFRWVIDQVGPRVVVMTTDIALEAIVHDLLTDRGYSGRASTRHHVVVWQLPQSQPPSS